MNKRKLREMEHYDDETSDDETPFVCDVCDFSFETFERLKKHKKTHKKSKKTEFVCEICQFECYELIELKEHVDSHFDDKCFACNACEFTCKLPFELRIHTEKRHAPAVTHDCDVCGFKSKLAKGLWVHKQTHRELICELCDFTCLKLVDLKEHIVTHTQSMGFSIPNAKSEKLNDVIQNVEMTVIDTPIGREEPFVEFDIPTSKSITKPKKVIEITKNIVIDTPIVREEPFEEFDIPNSKSITKPKKVIEISKNIVIKVSKPKDVKPVKTNTHKTAFSNGTAPKETVQWNANKSSGVKNFQDIFANFIK